MKLIKVKKASFSKDGTFKATNSETGESVVVEIFYEKYGALPDEDQRTNDLHLHRLFESKGEEEEIIIVENGQDLAKSISIALRHAMQIKHGKKS
jgi:hypothetical protein